MALALVISGAAMLGVGVCSCADRSEQGSGADSPSEARAAQSMAADGRVRVTAADARAKGLPAIGFSALWGDGDWSGTLFPEPGVYATLSGPPGGPQLFVVRGYRGFQARYASLPGLINQLDLPKPLKLGPRAKIQMARAERPAMGLLSGESLGKTQYCAVLVAPDPLKREGLLVLLGTGASPLDDTDCTMVATHPAIAPLVASFRLE